jgi:hypothetical protein
VPPAYALADVKQKIPRYRNFSVSQNGCRFWWIEYGGRLDTVHDTEKIKWELWKVIYGVWDYIKNSGEHPEAENLTLEWVGAIPGKRESRRFEGYSMLIQQDLIEQRRHEDAVSFGGWSIDLHPADGVYSPRRGCDQYHARGVYQIPYSTMITPDVKNLFLAGRIISVSHVAFGSTRVMGTCAHAAQAAGMAASICAGEALTPADLRAAERIVELQRRLARAGQYVPGLSTTDPDDLVQTAEVTASTTLSLDLLGRPAPERIPLDCDRAQMVPLAAGPVPKVRFRLDASKDTVLVSKLLASTKPGSFTPDSVLDEIRLEVKAGTDRDIEVAFSASLEDGQYVFFAFDANPEVRLHEAAERITGLLAVARRGRQLNDPDIGVEEFDFWTPDRRPGGHLFAFAVDSEYAGFFRPFEPEQVANGIDRPVTAPNAWVARLDDGSPTLTLRWTRLQRISQIVLNFDTDADHPMESVLYGHPEHAMPCCARAYTIRNGHGEVVFQESENHQTRNVVEFASPIETEALSISVDSVWGRAPASIVAVRCYAEAIVDRAGANRRLVDTGLG